MTERLADIEARLASITELQDVVGAMRSIAAARLQQAVGALAGTRAYAEVVAGAVASAVALLPEGRTGDLRGGERGGGGGRGVVLFCPEHGFTGAFTERLVEAVFAEPEPLPTLLVVGSRGAALLEERGRAPVWSLPMATQPAAVPTTARHVADALFDQVGSAPGRLRRVDMVYGRHHGGGPPTIERRALLPIDVDRFRRTGAATVPLTNLPPGRLVERLAEEYVLAELAHAAMESVAAENGARLATMQSARQNIAQTLETLQSAERRIRQEQITAELLELVTGTEALNGA
jgi:F-type H+-transporting ATPase subunit gamma